MPTENTSIVVSAAAGGAARRPNLGTMLQRMGEGSGHALRGQLNRGVRPTGSGMA